MTPAAIHTPHWRANGHGPPLVLINGWGASGLAWPQSWLTELARAFRVIRPDNRGTGWSRFAPVPFTVADLADDVAAVLDAADVDRAVVVGISMGGMIAQELALRSPERVSRLVLIATGPPVPAHRPRLRSPVLWQLMQPPSRGELAASYARRLWSLATAPGFGDKHPEVIDELARQSLDRVTPRMLFLQQARAALGWGHSERLEQIMAPTLVIHGSEDRLVDIADGRALARLIPNSTFVELTGVGHLVAHEAPDQLQALIVRAGPQRLARVS